MAESAHGAVPHRGSDGKAVCALRCGHCFDETCLGQWIATRAAPQCPVCRRSIEDAPGGGGAASAAAGAAAGAATGVLHESASLHEIEFRLQRIHAFHPLYVQQAQLDAWLRDNYGGARLAARAAQGPRRARRAGPPPTAPAQAPRLRGTRRSSSSAQRGRRRPPSPPPPRAARPSAAAARPAAAGHGGDVAPCRRHQKPC
jgi:hypothetical protein